MRRAKVKTGWAAGAIAASCVCHGSMTVGGAATEGYLNHDALAAACQRLDAEHAACVLEVIGSSREERGILLLTLAGPGADAALRPALLIIAGLDGRHLVGTETAMRVAERLLTEHADMLMDVTVYVVPRANPDAAERNLGPLNAGVIGTTRQIDGDRDDAVDEDGPDDLNGDGFITMMRRLNPPLDDPPTHLPDPNEPRLLKTPDPLKGQSPVYSLYVEGLDNDGDGLYNEDPPGFVDLDRNFMHMWPEHETDAGPYQLSEPESLALATFVIEHPNIVAAVVYGRHDNLINVPDGKAKDETGQSPRDIDPGDVELYKTISELYKEKTGQKKSPQPGNEGSFHAWLYAQRGVPTFASVAWTRPEAATDEMKGDKGEDAGDGAHAGGDPSGTWTGSIIIPEADTDVPVTVDVTQHADGSLTGSLNAMGNSVELHGSSTGGHAALGGSTTIAEQTYGVELSIAGEEMTGTVSGPGGMSARFTAQRTARDAGAAGTSDAQEEKKKDADKPADEDAAAWLKYSDEQRNGEGFINWTAFTHPTLGEVEIGGFVPGFQMNPPVEELDDIAAKQTEFIIELVSKRPRLQYVGPEVSRLAPGLYRIRFAITNEGLLPTVTSMSAQARAVTPTIVRLNVPIERIVAGERITRIWAINGSGGRSTHEWIVRATDHSRLDIEIESAQLGKQTVTVLAFESTADGAAQPTKERSP